MFARNSHPTSLRRLNWSNASSSMNCASLSVTKINLSVLIRCNFRKRAFFHKSLQEIGIFDQCVDVSNGLVQSLANELPFRLAAYENCVPPRAIRKSFDKFSLGKILQFHLRTQLNHIVLGHIGPLSLALLGIEDAIATETVDAPDELPWLRT